MKAAKVTKICLVIPSLGPGGMERVMSELANYLDGKNETEIHLILYGRKRELFYSVFKSVHIHRPSFKFDNSKRKYYTLKTMLFLRRRIKTLNPDVILSFGEDWNNLVLLSLVGFSCKIFVSDRAQPGLKRNFIQFWLSKLLYRKTKSIIVQTEIAKQIYEEIYAHNQIKVVGNPIRCIDSIEKQNHKENVVVSVGRLVNTKHFDLLIKIFAELNNSDWKLVIIGGDSQRQNVRNELDELIKSLNLQDRVILTGTVKNVDEYYRKSKIFAFTSSSEGFPNVIGEAMSAGLPIIAFDCIAGPSELIDDGANGYLIPLFNLEMFRNKLIRLMSDDQMRDKMGLKSKDKIKNYLPEHIGEKFYSILIEK